MADENIMIGDYTFTGVTLSIDNPEPYYELVTTNQPAHTVYLIFIEKLFTFLKQIRRRFQMMHFGFVQKRVFAAVVCF